MQNHQRSNSNDKKNRSMLSTQNMSCNQSHATNFYSENKPNRSLILRYADTPLEKITPHWNQSAATWRNTSHKYSFPRDTRFKKFKLQYTDIIEPEIPTTRSSKSCTFGKGNKKPISEIILRNAKEKPAPDRYHMDNFDESPRNQSYGKSFGISWKSYQKNYIDHRKDVYAPFQTQQNPPAHYQIRQSPGKDKRRFSMYGRLKMYTQKLAESKNWIPSAKYMIKDRHLQNQVGLHERNFGFGERLDLSMPANDYPGAKYIIPGFCSKFRRISKKLQNSSIEEQRINK